MRGEEKERKKGGEEERKAWGKRIDESRGRDQDMRGSEGEEEER